MIRFNTKDVVRKGGNRCGCGRTSRMIAEVAGRTDHLRKIRGVLFSPVAVEEVLRDEFQQVREYELIVERKGIMDEITLRIEPQRAMEAEALKELSGRIAQRLKVKTNLTMKIKPAAPGELPRYTLKSQRFKDLRG